MCVCEEREQHAHRPDIWDRIHEQLVHMMTLRLCMFTNQILVLLRSLFNFLIEKFIVTVSSWCIVYVVHVGSLDVYMF